MLLLKIAHLWARLQVLRVQAWAFRAWVRVRNRLLLGLVAAAGGDAAAADRAYRAGLAWGRVLPGPEVGRIGGQVDAGAERN